MEKQNISQSRILIAIVAVIVVVGAIYLYSAGRKARPIATVSVPVQTSTQGTSATATANASTSVSTVSGQNYYSKSLGLSFSYPSGWALGPNFPVSLDNFNHTYASDDSIPLGGAEIDMASTTAYASLASIAETELSGASGVSTSSVSVGGTSCTEYLYQSAYNPSVPSKNAATYCLRSGNALYKFYLSYRAADPKGPQYLAAFNQLLNGVQFAKQ